MRKPWWRTVWKIAGETLLSMTYFTFFVIGVVYTSALAKLVSHLTGSKFVSYVVTTLEYAVLVSEGLSLLTKKVRRAREEFRRADQ